jgi:hypothetical protein
VAFSAFDYSLGTSFQPVPGIDLTLTNDQNYNNEWTADLSALSAIENSGMVTLRWSLPDFDQGASKQLRVDDLQIIGTSVAPPSPGRTRYLPTGDYNVLFFAFDDLKANFGPFATPELAQAMPRPLTPNLDSLASMGMSFTRAYCQQAVCWASRISVMTGCRPDTTKIWDDGPNFRDTMPGVVSLPQHFAARGYNVAGYGKIYDFAAHRPNRMRPCPGPRVSAALVCPIRTREKPTTSIRMDNGRQSRQSLEVPAPGAGSFPRMRVTRTSGQLQTARWIPTSITPTAGSPELASQSSISSRPTT